MQQCLRLVPASRQWLIVLTNSSSHLGQMTDILHLSLDTCSFRSSYQAVGARVRTIATVRGTPPFFTPFFAARPSDSVPQRKPFGECLEGVRRS